MRITLIAIFLAIGLNVSFGQTFMHGAGFSVFVDGSKSGETTFGEGLTYSPRFNFLESEKLSVSVGLPLSIGLVQSTSSYTNSYDYSYGNTSSSVGLLINAPLIVNANFGRGSTKENTNKFGYFIGGGFGFNRGDFLNFVDDGYGGYYKTAAYNCYGPAINAGVRLGVGRKYRNIEIKAFYMKGLNEIKPNIVSVSGIFNF